MSSEFAPADLSRLPPPQSDLTCGGNGGGVGPDGEERSQHQQLPRSITSGDHDRTQSFQLAHNIHILPHLPKYSIIIQKKSNELLGELQEKVREERKEEKLSGAEATIQGYRSYLHFTHRIIYKGHAIRDNI